MMRKIIISMILFISMFKVNANSEEFKNCKITFFRMFEVKFGDIVPSDYISLSIRDTILDRKIYDLKFNGATYDQKFFIYNNPNLPGVLDKNYSNTPEYDTFVLSITNIFDGANEIVKKFTKDEIIMNDLKFTTTLTVVNNKSGIDTSYIYDIDFKELRRLNQDFGDMKRYVSYSWTGLCREKRITVYKQNSKLLLSEDIYNFRNINYKENVPTNRNVYSYLDSTNTVVETKQYLNKKLTNKTKAMYSPNFKLLKLFGYSEYDNSEYLIEENKYNKSDKLIETIEYKNGLVSSKVTLL